MAARATRLDYTQLTARERRRLAGTMLLRAAVVSTVAVVGYFWLPMQDWTDLALGAQLLFGCALIIGLIAWQIREIARSPYPQVRAVGGVTTSITIFLLVFATTYYLLGQAEPDSWTEPLSRLDAVYLAMTIFASVGFGDVTAVDPTARAIVTGQMLADLVIVGLVVRMVTRAVERGLQRQRPTSTSDATAAADEDHPERAP
jgi:hypothetical protein